MRIVGPADGGNGYNAFMRIRLCGLAAFLLTVTACNPRSKSADGDELHLLRVRAILFVVVMVEVPSIARATEDGARNTSKFYLRAGSAGAF